MKKLIITALNSAIIKLDSIIPKTKKETKSVDISDINPWDIVGYTQINNIPKNVAFHHGMQSPIEESAFWNTYGACLVWEIDVPTTDRDTLKYKRKKFSNLAWVALYDTLINNEYKRVGFNSGLLEEFNNTTIYDMYCNKEFDRLIKYYSLYFIKV